MGKERKREWKRRLIEENGEKEWTEELQYLDCVRTVLGCQKKKKGANVFK